MPDTFAALPPVVQNTLVFWLPFRFADADAAAMPVPAAADSALAASSRLLENLSSAKLSRLADGIPSTLKVWRQLGRTEALNKLSGDLYPVAGNILCGKPDDPATGCPSFILHDGKGSDPQAEQQKSGESLRVRLGKQEIFLVGKLASNGLPLILQLEDAWIRMFGTCFGLLAIQIVVKDPQREDGTISAEDFLQALHAIAQPARRNGDLLSTRNRYSAWTNAGEIAPEAMVVVDDEGRLSEIDIAGYAKISAKAAAKHRKIALYRCVSCHDVGQPSPLAEDFPHRFRIILEQIEAIESEIEPLPNGQQIGKGRRLVVVSAERRLENGGELVEGSFRVVDKDNPEATHKTLKALDRQTGRCWVEVLPNNSSFMDWIFALLPEMGKALQPAIGHVEQAAGETEFPYASWRLFSYAAVRFKDDGGDTAWCEEYAFRLARRFGDDYRPARAEIVEHVFAPFETLYHSVATQGAALVIRDSSVDFLKGFIGNSFATAYRPIAEICYHEYLYLLRLVQDSAILPKEPPDAAEIALLGGLTHALTSFRLYYRFAKISHMSQHNQVLAIWREALGLDEIEVGLARDVSEAHRLLEAKREEELSRLAKEHNMREARRAAEQARREDAREKRWRKIGIVGIPTAVFLSTMQLVDALATYRCPPETLQVALTDAQVNGASLLPILPDLLQRPDLGGDASMAPMDRLCATPGLQTAPQVPGEAGAARDSLDDTITSESKETYRQRLLQVCTTTHQARVCAGNATSVRTYGPFVSIAIMVFAFGIAWRFMPR